jgi:PAT family acetyl-CoA transporter-like MFS transporter 1
MKNMNSLSFKVLIDFPFQLFFGYYAARWSNSATPLRPWLIAFYGRLFFAVVGMLVVASFPSGGVTSSYFFVVIFTTVLSSFMRFFYFFFICFVVQYNLFLLEAILVKLVIR